MRVLYLSVLISCLSYQPADCSAADDHIDPFDMLNYDRATKTMKKPTARTRGESTQNDDRCRVFLPRFVNILLKNTGISVSISVPYYTCLLLTLLCSIYFCLYDLVMCLFRIQIINLTKKTTNRLSRMFQ